MENKQSNYITESSIEILNIVTNIILTNSLTFFLFKIYGIKNFIVTRYLIKLGLSKNILIKDINNFKFKLVCLFINQEGKAQVSYQIDKTSILFILKNIETYKGIRHKKGLPARGQRTHSNRNTARYLFKKQ